MRSGASFLVLLALVLTGCGGGSKNLAKSAVPCLEKLGPYFHHEPRPTSVTNTTPSLPVSDPGARDFPRTQLPWPEDFQEYGEINYDASAKGANAVQILIFGSEQLPKRVVATATSAATGGTFLPPGRRTQRVGQTILLWSSAPTTAQRRGVVACLQ